MARGQITTKNGDGFARTLRRYRERTGLTQRAASKQAGFSTGHQWSRWERDVRLPVLPQVAIIADVLSLTDEETAALVRSSAEGVERAGVHDEASSPVLEGTANPIGERTASDPAPA